MFQSCFKQIPSFYRKLFQTRSEAHVKQHGHVQQAVCPAACLSVCVHVYEPHSHLKFTKVFCLPVWTLHFHAFPTLKQIPKVCVSMEVNLFASHHLLFSLFPHPFFSSPQAIFDCHLLNFQALCFPISRPSVFFSSPLTFCPFLCLYSGCQYCNNIQKFILLKCFLLISFPCCPPLVLVAVVMQ